MAFWMLSVKRPFLYSGLPVCKENSGPSGFPSYAGSSPALRRAPEHGRQAPRSHRGVSVLPDSKRGLNINSPLAASVPDAPLQAAR